MGVRYPGPRVGVKPLPALLAVMVVISAAAAVVLWHKATATSPPQPVAGNSIIATATAAGSAAPSPAATATPPHIVASVVGAVEHPGLVTLTSGARTAEALEQAVLKPQAEPAAVNLAAVVADGSQIVVPEKGAAPVQEGPATGGREAAPGAVVDINSASLAQLTSLTGIGEKTAQAIIAERESNGPFASPEDLARVKGIGPATVSRLRGQISAGG